MQDESLHDTTIPVDDAEDIMVEYYMVDSGTERGKRKLVDSTGFSYTVKKNDHVLWRCTKRSKTINCPATIIQDGDNYRPGQKQHIHAGDQGCHIALRIKAEVKQQAKQAKFEERSSSIVEKASRPMEIYQHQLAAGQNQGTWLEPPTEFDRWTDPKTHLTCMTS
eukprot:XP_019927498.1 PREDICTED: uncharacterized protein LOC105339689 isoform X2 [Crassostrea gigas]